MFPFSQKGVVRVLLASVLAGSGLLASVMPSFQSHSSGWGFNAIANAQQAISNEELRNYARSVLAIEPIRRTAYDEIKRLLGTADVPPIACHRPNSFNSLSRDVRRIAVSYCNQSIQIVESNSLTISRFNAITTVLQSDSTLSERVQQELLRLQQGAGSP